MNSPENLHDRTPGELPPPPGLKYVTGRESRRRTRRRTNLRYLALLAVLVLAPLLIPAPPALLCKKSPGPSPKPAKVVPVESVRYDNRPAEEFEATPLNRNRD